jgi:hypothetical protein
MIDPTVPSSPASREPVAGRAWSSPGLLRRVEARRSPPTRDPRRSRSIWSRLHGRPWSAEGTVMILVAAVCIGLTALAISAARGGPGLIPAGAPGCTVTAGRGSAVPCLPGAH